MSKFINSSSQEWQTVLTSLGCLRSIRGGVELSKRDHVTYCEILVLNAVLLIGLAPEDSRRSHSNLVRWVRYCVSIDVLQFAATTKKILQSLLRVEGEITLCVFKQHLGLSNTEFGAITAPVLDYLIRFLKTGEASDLAVLNQFLAFSSRTTLVDLDIQDEMVEDYLRNEERLKTLQYNKNTVDALNCVIKDWFKTYSPEYSSGKHGPGASAFQGRIAEYSKWALMQGDDRLKYLYKNHFNYFYLSSPIERTAQVRFVPKSIQTMRTICMEPVPLMFAQQQCWNQQHQFIRTHPYLSKIIKFTDQRQNRWFAMLGSKLQNYCTIDLSAASDSVSWSLIKDVFRGTPLLREYWCTRSDKISVSDSLTIAPEKFAPMGSALCFPTECLLFAAICEVALRENGTSRRQCYTVYGDDIIVWNDLLPRVLELLAELGFLVNASKSFTAGFFRESCGGEYWKGVDVTPIRIPRNFRGGKIHSKMPDLFECCRELCNTLYSSKSDFRIARLIVLAKFSSLPITLRPLFDDGTLGIASSQPTNFDKSIKVKFQEQTKGVVYGGIATKDGERLEDETSLMMWTFHALARSESRAAIPGPEDILTVRTSLPTVALKKKYTPLPLLSEELAYDFIAAMYEQEEKVL